MRLRLARWQVLVLVGALLLAGCESVTSAPSPLPSGLYAVPTIDTGKFDACAGVGLADARLTGSPEDPRVAWLTGKYGRKDVVFPAAFTARFTPDLEILDAGGKVVARDGQVIEGGCVTSGDPSGPLLILWP